MPDAASGVTGARAVRVGTATKPVGPQLASMALPERLQPPSASRVHRNHPRCPATADLTKIATCSGNAQL
ncbi:MAG: hypothetical protein RL173_146 [Fibrobacterota bacterium]